jgi:hypothetical protein
MLISTFDAYQSDNMACLMLMWTKLEIVLSRTDHFFGNSLSSLSFLFPPNVKVYVLGYSLIFLFSSMGDVEERKNRCPCCKSRHYNKAGVGDGWFAAARELNLDGTDVWLQTKFSGLTAHNPNNVPYDVNASLEDWVRQSLQKSLKDLKTDYLDSWNNWDDHWKVSIT